jgi:hypothetical protein
MLSRGFLSGLDEQKSVLDHAMRELGAEIAEALSRSLNDDRSRNGRGSLPRGESS